MTNKDKAGIRLDKACKRYYDVYHITMNRYNSFRVEHIEKVVKASRNLRKARRKFLRSFPKPSGSLLLPQISVDTTR